MERDRWMREIYQYVENGWQEKVRLRGNMNMNCIFSVAAVELLKLIRAAYTIIYKNVVNTSVWNLQSTINKHEF